MANDKTTLRFWHRIDRPNKDGSAPVHLVYQIQGQKRLYSVPGVKLFPINWDLENQLAIHFSAVSVKQKSKSLGDLHKKLESSNDKRKQQNLKREAHSIENAMRNVNTLPSFSDIADINYKLQAVINEVADVEKRFKLDKKTFSPKMVVDTLKELKKPETKKDLPDINIVDFIDRFIKETSDHREGTIKEYRGLANKMKEYEKLKKVKFTFEGDASILKGFSGFLTSVKEINNITKAKLFSTFKTMLRHAKKAPYKIKSNIDYFDFSDKSTKRKDSEFEVIALTEEEFNAIYKLDLSSKKSLDEARDIFCFSCVTSLRYGDLEQLQRKHIKKDNTIVIPMSDKNDKKIEIPLNPISHAILQKYADRLHPLPVTSAKQKLISNQKLNNHIKTIGKMAGIDTEIEMVRPYGLESVSLGMFPKYEWLSIHSGRKTFTTLSLARGMAIQEVMGITTHSSFKAVKRYIDITKERKKLVMATAWGEVPVLKAVK